MITLPEYEFDVVRGSVNDLLSIMAFEKVTGAIVTLPGEYLSLEAAQAVLPEAIQAWGASRRPSR